jgi:hypothetical protein
MERNQKSALHFQLDKDGPDRVYAIDIPHGKIDLIRGSLAEHGFTNRSIQPVAKDLTRVILYDDGGQSAKAAATFATANSFSDAKVMRGHGEFIGASWGTIEKGNDADARAEARNAYSEIIERRRRAAA